MNAELKYQELKNIIDAINDELLTMQAETNEPLEDIIDLTEFDENKRVLTNLLKSLQESREFLQALKMINSSEGIAPLELIRSFKKL